MSGKSHKPSLLPWKMVQDHHRSCKLKKGSCGLCRWHSLKKGLNMNCLTRTRCKQSGYYIPKLLRRLSPVEMAKLQGLPLAVANPLLATANDLAAGSFEEAVGDAMSINVLQTLPGRVCTSAGLAHVPAQKEYWLLCPAEKLHQLSDQLWAKHK